MNIFISDFIAIVIVTHRTVGRSPMPITIFITIASDIAIGKAVVIIDHIVIIIVISFNFG